MHQHKTRNHQPNQQDNAGLSMINEINNSLWRQSALGLLLVRCTRCADVTTSLPHPREVQDKLTSWSFQHTYARTCNTLAYTHNHGSSYWHGVLTCSKMDDIPMEACCHQPQMPSCNKKSPLTCHIHVNTHHTHDDIAHIHMCTLNMCSRKHTCMLVHICVHSTCVARSKHS